MLYRKLQIQLWSQLTPVRTQLFYNQARGPFWGQSFKYLVVLRFLTSDKYPARPNQSWHVMPLSTLPSSLCSDLVIYYSWSVRPG